MADQYHDSRPQGQMGTGYVKVKMDLETTGKALSENAEGWDSKSFDGKFKKGVDPAYCYPDEYNDEDGPAWESHSKNRK